MPTNRYRGPAIRILERKDIVQLLWREVQTAGSQTAWAKNNSVDRTHLNKVMHDAKPLSESMICALGLRTAVIDGGSRVLAESDIIKLLSRSGDGRRSISMGQEESDEPFESQ
jgi:hypothetical protein